MMHWSRSDWPVKSLYYTLNNKKKMNELIEYYLKNEEKRQRIAKKGQDFVLEHFDCKPLVSNILTVLKTGKSQNSWDEIY